MGCKTTRNFYMPPIIDNVPRSPAKNTSCWRPAILNKKEAGEAFARLHSRSARTYACVMDIRSFFQKPSGSANAAAKPKPKPKPKTPAAAATTAKPRKPAVTHGASARACVDSCLQMQYAISRRT